jgi:polysaccharide biosynthesis protein PslG
VQHTQRGANSPARRILLLLLGLLILASLTLELTTVYHALAANRSMVPTTPQRLANTDLNPYGANLFLEREVEAWKRDKTLKMASEAGLDWVKLHFPWEEIEPAQKGDFFVPATHGSSWDKFDQIVAACEQYGLNIVARLDRPPRWSRKDNTLAEAPPDNYQDYADFVYQFVNHYKGRIHYIQVWNEPNIYPEWGNQAVDPAQYTTLLKLAYAAAKRADPGINVLSAPLAYTLGQAHPEPGKWISMNDLDYLEAMYQAGAKDYFDIYSTNAFGFDRTPEDPPDPTVLNFQRVVLQRRIMENHGDVDKAVWFNEFGWNAAPDTMATDKLIWQRVSETDQAAYTVRAIQLARRDWPWAGVFMIWYLRQVGTIPPDQADYYFRMIDTDFTPRPLYAAIQEASRIRQAAGAGIYQESYPLVRTTGTWKTVVDSQTSANAYMYTEQPSAMFTLTFRGTHLELLSRRGPLDGILQVWLDDKPVPGLAQAEGISVINLAADQATFEWITLWSGTDPGPHTVKLSLAPQQPQQSPPGSFVLDAIRISNEAPAFPWLQVVLGGLLVVACCAALVWVWKRGWRPRPQAVTQARG